MSDPYMYSQHQELKHTEGINQKWVIFNVPRQLAISAQLPDLNSIEHFFVQSQKRIYSAHFSSKEAIYCVISDEWEKLTAAQHQRHKFKEEQM